MERDVAGLLRELNEAGVLGRIHNLEVSYQRYLSNMSMLPMELTELRRGNLQLKSEMQKLAYREQTLVTELTELKQDHLRLKSDMQKFADRAQTFSFPGDSSSEALVRQLSPKPGDASPEMLNWESRCAEFTKELTSLSKFLEQRSDLQQEKEEEQTKQNIYADERAPAIEGQLGQTVDEGLETTEKGIKELEVQVGAVKGSNVQMDRQASFGLHEMCEYEYNWQNSLWDVSIFIGSECMTTGSSVATVMCLVVYLVLCTAIVSESSYAMNQASFDEETRHQFQYWRNTIAHDLSLRNPVTGESLASSVCHQRMYVPYATLQLHAFGLLSEYSEAHPVFGTTLKRGVLMCILVLSVWFLKLLEDVGNSLDFFAVCLQLPITLHTTFQQDVMNPSKADLVSISRGRFVFVVFLFTAKMVVAFFVGFYGSVFLIQEASVPDMLMNALSMDLVLNLDDLIFSALLPKKPTSTCERINPLKFSLGSSRHKFYKIRKCLEWQRLSFVLLVMGLGVLTKVLILDPHVVELERNRDALCGRFDDSSLDFVMRVDSIGIPWAATTPSSSNIADTYAQYAVSEVSNSGFPYAQDSGSGVPLQGDQRLNLGLFMQLSSAFELQSYTLTRNEFKHPHGWTIINPNEMGEVVGWNEALVLGDTDFGDGPGTVYNRYLKFLLGASGEVSCADVPVHLCYETGNKGRGLVMMKLCPSWCGCDSPTTGTTSSAVAKIPQGCSAWVTKKKRFQDTLGDLPCADTLPSYVFNSWLQGIGGTRNASGGLLADQAPAAFEKGGCNAIAQIDVGHGKRFCQESSLPAICPTSCGCDLNVGWSSVHAWREDYCPLSCGRAQFANCFTISVQHTDDTGSYGPFVGFQCIFPFTYKGKTFNNCTTFDWSGPWCAVTTRKGGRMFQWGDCPPGC